MKDETTIPEQMEYRIALIQPHSGKLLVMRDSGGNRLPRIRVAASARVTRELRHAIRHAFGLNVLILDFVFPDTTSSPIAFAEILSESQVSCLAPAEIAQVSDGELADEERHRLWKIVQGRDVDPFTSLGWLRSATAWLEETTGIRVSSQQGFEQYNAGFGYTLMRFQMNDGSAYWLKATAEPNRHERAVTTCLSELCWKHLPTLAGSYLPWNAWIMREEAASCEQRLENRDEAQLLLPRVVASMAALQAATMGHTNDLQEAGAFDQRLTTLAAHSDEIFAYIEDAMGQQTSKRVARVDARRLREIRDDFEEACHRLDRFGFPETVIHGDMNPGNILISPSRCQFIDWSEAYIGNPLITLEHMLLLNPSETSEARRDLDKRMRTEYCSVFSQFCDIDQMEIGLCYMPLLAAFSTIYARGDWWSTDARNNPQRRAYARMLARHMDRATRDLRHCLGFAEAFVSVPVDLQTPGLTETDVAECMP